MLPASRVEPRLTIAVTAGISSSLQPRSSPPRRDEKRDSTFHTVVSRREQHNDALSSVRSDKEMESIQRDE